MNKLISASVSKTMDARLNPDRASAMLFYLLGALEAGSPTEAGIAKAIDYARDYATSLTTFQPAPSPCNPSASATTTPSPDSGDRSPDSATTAATTI